MSCEAPLPIPLAVRATHEGKYGLQRLPFVDPHTGKKAYVSSLNGYSGPELKVEFPTGNDSYEESYWTAQGDHICGNIPPENNTFSEPQWAITPQSKKG